MFGLYRTLLALMVVADHLGHLTLIGAFAVFGFYILSGYLMTFIMHRNYGYTAAGFARYALNRFLRIYPIYWLSIALSCVLVLWLGAAASRAYQPQIYLPDSVASWARNLLIVLGADSTPRLTPPSWALTVELFYYLVIGLGLSRFRWLAVAWLGAAILYHVAVNIGDFGWEWKYFYIPAAAMPFATGSVIYHFREQLGPFTRQASVLAPLTFALMLANWLALRRSGHHALVHFYFNYVLNAGMVALLAAPAGLKWLGRRWDDLLGQLSYPIYVVHIQAGLLVTALAGLAGVTLLHPSRALLVAALPGILGLAWLMTFAAERPLEVLRDRVREQARAGAARPSVRID